MLPRGALLFDQRFEVLSLLNLCTAIVAAAMVSDHLRAVDDAQFVGISEQR
jgi:hypothetical protein